MCIRKATHNDFATIRTLPVQMTTRPVTSLQPKHFRVLFQENNVRLLVNEGLHAVSGFISLRFMPALDSGVRFLVIVHLSLDRHALRQGIAAELEAQAASVAKEHHCAALLVQAKKLPPSTISFYRDRGYCLDNETLIKKIA